MNDYMANLEDFSFNEIEEENEELFAEMNTSEQFFMEGMNADELPSERLRRLDYERLRE